MAAATGAMDSPHRTGATEWPGHRRATQAALVALFDRTAVGTGDASQADRVLVTASEFWAAAANRDLATYLSEDGDEELKDARAAFDAIGANLVADWLGIAIDTLRQSQSAGQAAEVVQALQARLVGSMDAIDESIERFAIRVIKS